MPVPPKTLVEALLRREAYPQHVETVTLRETHISWVFLTGEFAYKIKKPVKTPFLDFSTLDRRLAACREEWRLNRRFAPDLYMDVLPISGSSDAPRVGGAGEPIEFALQMRQFPEAALLSHMVANQTLSVARIDELAVVMGDFHRGAACVTVSELGGHPAAILCEMAENLLALEAFDVPGLRTAAERLRHWADDAGRRLAPMFASRRSAGFVRECHGDLHLGNIVIWNVADPSAAPGVGRVTPFDGIEFNPELRWIDIVSDIAFAVMDLSDRGRPDLSHRLLNAWLERTGDYPGLAVLDWYLVYRALVRAKVAVIRAQQVNEASSAWQSQLDEASQYVRLAESYAQVRPRRLAITVGLSGSGKTTGTQALVDVLGMIRVRSDVERKRMAGLNSAARTTSPVAEGIYASEWTQQTYERLAALAREVLQAGRSVVVDATFLQHEQRSRFRELARQLHVEFCIIPFEADLAVLRRRVAARQHAALDASEAGLEVLEYQWEHREPLTNYESSCTRSLAELLGTDLPAAGLARVSHGENG